MELEETTKKTLTEAISKLSGSGTEELSKIAYNNLKTLISDPNGALASDPELCMETYKELAKLNQQEMETKRRLLDTYIKYHTVVNNQAAIAATPAPNILPEETGEENSTFA